MSLPPVKIAFAEAKAYKLPFGKYQGLTLDVIAMTDAGLKYLDWARGALRLDFHSRNAIESYLDDPTIAADLTKLVRG